MKNADVVVAAGPRSFTPEASRPWGAPKQTQSWFRITDKTLIAPGMAKVPNAVVAKLQPVAQRKVFFESGPIREGTFPGLDKSELEAHKTVGLDNAREGLARANCSC